MTAHDTSGPTGPTTGPTSDGRLVLEAGPVRIELSPGEGGRLASFRFTNRELLVTRGPGPIWWGCFPMVPFAGRIRHGRLTFEGRDHELERRMPPHAIHGTVLDRAWSVESSNATSAVLSIDLGPGWPFDGRVVQELRLEPDHLAATLRLEAGEPMPASIGWHPWFRRRPGPSPSVDAGPGEDLPLELAFDPGWMLERDAEGLPSGELIHPTSGPWDDCFTDVRAAPTLHWPDLLELSIASSAQYWVVFTEPDDALCVEPQTAPPNAVNTDPTVVVPGEPLLATMDWRWRGS